MNFAKVYFRYQASNLIETHFLAKDVLKFDSNAREAKKQQFDAQDAKIK